MATAIGNTVTRRATTGSAGTTTPIGCAPKGADLGELTKDLAGVPAELHQTTWCAEKTIEFMEANRDRPWFASVNIYDPHPPFNPPQAYRDQFDPREVKPPLFRESDLAQQAKLAAIDFQSEARRPDDLDIKSPILPQSPASSYIEAETGGQRDARTLIAAYYAMIKLIDDQVGRISGGAGDQRPTRQYDRHLHQRSRRDLGDHGLIQKGCRFYEGLVRVPLDLVLAREVRRRAAQQCPGRTDRYRADAAGGLRFG